MTWFRMDDEFWRHRKVRRLGRHQVSVQVKVAAAGLWALAGDWSSDNLTDGFVPAEQLEEWDPDGVLTARLLDVGLFDPACVDGERGVEVHDYLDRNRSKADVLAERAYNARKAALHRDKPLLLAVRTRDENRCRYCGTLVNWKDRRSGSGGTYDHVEPDGPNSLDNLVVACRSCNSEKLGRTPDEAGMPLLPPGSMGAAATQTGSGSVLDTDQIGSGTDQGPDPTRPDPGPPPSSGDPGEGGEQPARPAAVPASPATRAAARELAGLTSSRRRRDRVPVGNRPLMTSVAPSRASPADTARGEQDRLAELDAVQTVLDRDATGGPGPPGDGQEPPPDQERQDSA